MPEPLAARLRRETKGDHADAERSGIMRAILGGRVDPGAYCRMLRGLHEIYAALEAALVRHAAAPDFSLLPIGELRRTEALAADLDVLCGPEWRHDVPLGEAAAAYAARLTRLADESPERLLAHVYVRYLGDLSGGQILRRLIAKGVAIAPDAGGSFYEFGDAVAVGALKERVREALNRLPADGAAADRIVEEAKLAFAMHVRFFEELAGAGPECVEALPPAASAAAASAGE